MSLSSCRTSTDQLEQKFAKYPSDKNVVAVLDNSIFYFTDHILNLRNIVKDEVPNHGYLFLDGKLYFSVSKQNAALDFSFLVYECDVYGNNLELVFEKHGYKTKPWATGKQSVLYLEYYETNALDNSSRVIDSYNISTGVYENVSNGDGSSLEDYRKDTDEKYTFQFENSVISITDTQNNENYKISDKTLHESDFGDILIDLDYSFYGYNETNSGKIYLVYRIKSNGSQYPHFICEYIPNTDEVVFKSLFFSNDVETISVESINDN